MEEETTERKDEAQKAAEVEEAYKQGEEKVKELEEDPPKNLEDWPDDHAKYMTFGGPRGRPLLRGGAGVQARPVRRSPQRDGSVEIDGEKVDNP